MDGNKLKAKINITRIRYYNEDNSFGIIVFEPFEALEGNEVKDFHPKMVAKGNMPKPSEGEYVLEAKEVTDKKWGKQYQIDRLYRSIFLDPEDKKAQRLYLETLFSEGQVREMYDTLEDPYKALMDEDVAQLVQVKGCGFYTAKKWLERFKDDLDKSRIYTELSEYNFTANMIKRLLDHFRSPDLVIQTIKNNPYALIDIKGFGWKTCDSIAIEAGLPLYSRERVEAFIKSYLREVAQNGYTYVYTNEQLMPAILQHLGQDIPDGPIVEAIHKLGNQLWWSDDKTKIGLKYFVNLEKRIAQKLIELRNAENNFKYQNWREIITQQEAEQGWEYTDQQREAIRLALEQQVILITGGAGTGKSSVVGGILRVLKKYDFAQCALSGRAAARLAEVTGQEGYTIHRLLGYPLGDPEHQGYLNNEDSYLSTKIVILDEVSMVSGEMFWYLIRALEPGTKLILLGDVGQLESIGCANVAGDIIASKEITSIMLDKIHRQAAASAIITDSLNIRNGNQVIENGFAGTVTRGELQDLTYECYSDANNTFYKVTELANELYHEGYSVLDTQVVVPNKEKPAGTWNLNLALQEIYNPSTGGDELLVSYGPDKANMFRVGDKVINVENNYESVTYEGQWGVEREKAADMGEECPVFNGNMGIILAINMQREEMIVDFIGIGKVLITKGMLKNILLGYAVTVHKMQGSQFPYVIFGMDFSSYSLLSRQMVYTAITRASKHCWVVAQNRALRYAVSQNNVSKKQTILVEMLDEVAHPKMIF